MRHWRLLGLPGSAPNVATGAARRGEAGLSLSDRVAAAEMTVILALIVYTAVQTSKTPAPSAPRRPGLRSSRTGPCTSRTSLGQSPPGRRLEPPGGPL